MPDTTTRPLPSSAAGTAIDRAVVAAEELAAVMRAVSRPDLERLIEAVNSAEAVYLVGGGRSGLVARAIAMRLMHVGLPAYVIGDTVTPGLPPGALLWVISATGSGAALRAQLQEAHTAGARIAAFSAKRESPITPLVDLLVLVPARHGGVESVQHAGSLFEQASLVLGDSVAGAIQGSRGITDEEMNPRHFGLY